MQSLYLIIKGWGYYAKIFNERLAFIGYNVHATTQTAEVSLKLWKTYTGLYSSGYIIAVLALLFIYPLSKNKTQEMLKELTIKRKNSNMSNI